MAMNPMQRRARNSFLIGFLVALIVMAVVVLLLVNKLKDEQSKYAALDAKIMKNTIYVTTRDLNSGDIVTSSDIDLGPEIITTVPESEIVSPVDLADEEDEDKRAIIRVDVPAGQIITKDMIELQSEKTTNSDRIAEYNMFILPSTLKNGDYIDIRLLLPSGKDYIVLPKKRVLGCNATTIWLKVTEDEILLLNNAIVESYTISGSKLYASLYAEAGLQDAATSTYLPSADVMALIIKDPNILNEAKMGLNSRYDLDTRVSTFDAALEPYKSTQDSIVASKNSEEVSSIRSARQGFVSSLEGTEEIGYDR